MDELFKTRMIDSACDKLHAHFKSNGSFPDIDRLIGETLAIAVSSTAFIDHELLRDELTVEILCEMVAMNPSCAQSIVDGEFPTFAEQVANKLAGARNCGFVSGDRPVEALMLDEVELKRGQRFGPFELVEHLGTGGMGTVWKATQKDPILRDVAIKFIRTTLSSPSLIARFKTEQQSLAVVCHPNIAQVIDSGSTDEGHPFYAMEFVEGLTLIEHAKLHTQSVRDRVRLFLPICQAVQHAHQNGIIHRDLKPSNVIVTSDEEAAYPKIIDFGLAKVDRAIAEPDVFGVSHTAIGQVLGTPDYMSPEQTWLGESPERSPVDTRTDIYSLGAMLYELLSGYKPFEQQRLKEIGLDEAIQVIRNIDPAPPSRNRGNGNSMGLQKHPELDWIVMKCLEKDRGRRYDSAAQLADDLQRFLDGHAVEAAPPSRTYQIKKLIKRNILLTSYVIAVTIGLALISLVAVLLRNKNAELASLNSQVIQANQLAIAEKDNAENTTNYISRAFRRAGAMQSGKNVKVVDALSEAMKNLDDDFPEENTARANIEFAIGETFLGLGEAERAFELLMSSFEMRKQFLQDGDPKLSETAFAVSKAAYHLEKKELIIDLLTDEILKFEESGVELPFQYWQMKCFLDVTHALNGRPEHVDEAIEAVAEMARIRSLDDLEVLEAQVNVGDCIDKKGDSKETIRFLTDLVARLKKICGRKHLLTLRTQRELGSALSKQRSTQSQAIEVLSEVFATTRQILGERDQTFSEAGNTLGFAYYRTGQYEKARQFYESLYETMLENTAADNPMWVYIENNYGESLGRTYRLTEALPLLVTSLDRRKKSYAASDARVLIAEHDVVVVELQLGRLDSALTKICAIRKTINDSGYRTHLSEKTMGIVRRRVELTYAEAVRVSGEPKRAVEILKPLVESMKLNNPVETVPPDYLFTLGNAQLDAGESERALKTWDEAIKSCKDTELSNITLLNFQREKAWALFNTNREQEAKELLRDTIETYQISVEAGDLPEDFVPFLVAKLYFAALFGNKNSLPEIAKLHAEITHHMGENSPLLAHVVERLKP